MRAVAENLIRASMSSVDIWRAIERPREAQGWNEQAIGDALALPVRTVRRLKLLAHLHPAMLDVMALGSMPSEEHLRTIAAATREVNRSAGLEEAQASEEEASLTSPGMRSPARAGQTPHAGLRLPSSATIKAKAYGIVWEDDLFAPPSEDSRYTTNVEGLLRRPAGSGCRTIPLPERGTLLPVDEYGRGQLPKKAEQGLVYSKPAKTDLVGHLHRRCCSGEVETHRLPAARAEEGRQARRDGTKTTTGAAGGGDDDDAPIARTRPDVTQKSVAMIRRPSHRCAASGARRHTDRGRYPARDADPRLRRRQRHRRQRQRPARR